MTRHGYKTMDKSSHKELQSMKSQNNRRTKKQQAAATMSLSICLAKKRKEKKKSDAKHNNETESVLGSTELVCIYFVRNFCTFTVSLI